MRLVVCDSGPMIHLREAGALELLRSCGEIAVGGIVQDETTGRGHELPAWISRHVLAGDALREVTMLTRATGLHDGEAETIVLCRSLNANWLLTDDASARYCASAAGIEVHGTLGVVLYNAAVGTVGLEEARRVLVAIRKGSLCVSNRVFDLAVAGLGNLTQIERGRPW